MTIANTSETQLAYVAETTWGTTPATPAFKLFRMTGESLTYDIQNKVSDEINPRADVTDLIQTGADAKGDVNFELSFGTEFSTLLESALRGAFVSNILRTGVVKSSYSLEKLFETGTTDQYLRFQGERVNMFELQVQAQNIIKGKFGFMGKGGTNATTAIAGATYAAVNTNPVMSAPDVANITVGGISGSIYFTDLSFSVNNNCRAQNAVGNLSAIGIAYGRREITGKMTAYFEDAQLYALFVAGTESSITFETTDGSNTYTWTFPRIKYSSGSVVAGANNQDVFSQMAWQALLYDSTGASMQVENA